MDEYSLSDDEIFVAQFRIAHNEQFQMLLRMHLSYILNFKNESEVVSEKSKVKKLFTSAFTKFNGELIRDDTGVSILPVTKRLQMCELIDFLQKDQNLKSEGIFRRTGSIQRQQDLRSLINQGKPVVLEDGTFSVHDCASVLKSLMAELPEPLLTTGYYADYFQVVELLNQTGPDSDKLICALQLLLLLLPEENRKFLKRVLELLHHIVALENFNRMSAKNLATLFTPHLLCPRNVTAQQLHLCSQKFCDLVSVMIEKAPDLFKIPSKPLMDLRAEYVRQQAQNDQNDVPRTLFTFVDQARTAKETEEINTDTALAQLYAHIQSLPESAKKRKLIKQFNKGNGCGTPVQYVRHTATHNKQFGSSSKKKFLFRRTLLPNSSSSGSKKSSKTRSKFCGIMSKSPQYCSSEDTPLENCTAATDSSTSYKGTNDEPIKLQDSIGQPEGTSVNIKCEPNNQQHETPRSTRTLPICSTPECRHSVRFLKDCETYTGCTPENQRISVSPITRSATIMCKDMQERMMTPRSRKPVLLNSKISLSRCETAPNSKNDELVTPTSANAETKKSVNSSPLPKDIDLVMHSLKENSVESVLTEETSSILFDSNDKPSDFSFYEESDSATL